MTGLDRLLAAMRDAAEVGSIAVHRFGVVPQLEMAEEEAAELILAIKHFKRGKEPALKVVEEAADAIVTALQAALICGKAEVGFSFDDLANELTYKVNRLRQRIEAAKEGGR